MAYATAALIRAQHAAFKSATDYPDATILAWATNHTDPMIDGRLKAAGYTTPIPATQPAEIIAISTLLAASHGIMYHTHHTFTEDSLAAKMRAEAMERLEAIATGKHDVGLTRSASGAPIVVDSDPDTYPDTAGAVGHEKGWTWYTEDRE